MADSLYSVNVTKKKKIIRERLENNFKRNQEEEILDNQPLLDYDSNFAMS